MVIPTCNRPGELEILLNKLSLQTANIAEVVVVDSSDTPVCIKFSNTWKFNLKIQHVSIKSAAIQRNIGKDMISKDCDYLCYLDDDVQPDPTYISRLIAGMEEKQAVGISGIAINPSKKGALRRKPSGFFGFARRFFKLDSLREGVLLKSGINIPIRRYEGNLQQVEWLIGCAVWRFQVVSDLSFESDFIGQSLNEDVIFSFRASLRGPLFVDPTIHLNHFESEIARPKGYEFWSMWVINRKRLIEISTEGRLRFASFHFSNFGQFLSLVFSGARKGARSPFQAFGILLGYLRLIQRKNICDH